MDKQARIALSEACLVVARDHDEECECAQCATLFEWYAELNNVSVN